MQVKELTVKELLNQLPGSWSELKLKQFLAVMDVEVDDSNKEDQFSSIDYTIQVIHQITGVDVDSLEALPLFAIHQLGEKMSFMLEQPQPLKRSPLKLKTIDELSYDDFVTFSVMSKDPIRNLPLLIKTFSQDKITEDQVKEMNMVDCQTVFFFVHKRLKKYLNRSIQSLKRTVWIQETNQKKNKSNKAGKRKTEPLPTP